MGKERMARLSRRLWGGTSLKTAAKEANVGHILPTIHLHVLTWLGVHTTANTIQHLQNQQLPTILGVVASI